MSTKAKFDQTNNQIFNDKVLDNLLCLEEIVDSLIGILLDQFNHTL
jgi:hypothetical protein